MPRVEVRDYQYVWNAKLFGLQNYQATKSNEDVGIRIEYDNTGVLPPGIYSLVTVMDKDNQIWWLIQGTTWGAFKDTWKGLEHTAPVSILDEDELPGAICTTVPLALYVWNKYNGRDLETYLGRSRISRISLQGHRLVEEILTNGCVLSDHTLEYLPANATVEGDLITFPLGAIHESQCP